MNVTTAPSGGRKLFDFGFGRTVGGLSTNLVTPSARYRFADSFSDAGVTPCVDGDPIYQTTTIGTAVQTNALYRPTYRATGLNGLPCAQFVGPSFQHMFHGFENQPATVIIVGILTDTNPSRDNVWVNADQSDNSDQIGAYYVKCSSGSGRDKGIDFAPCTLADTNGANDASATQVRSFGSFPVIQAGRIADGASHCWVNGSKTAQKSFSSPLRTIKPGTPVIGGSWYAGSLGIGEYPYGWLTGKIADILFFETALTEDQLMDWTASLAAIYFPTVSLSSFLTPTFDGTSVSGEYFRNGSSPDGHTVTEFVSSLVPKQGTCRDSAPFYIGGKWFMAYTTGSFDKSTSFEIAISDRPQGPYRFHVTVDCVSATGDGAGARCWGPIWFQDGDTIQIQVSCCTDITQNLGTGDFKQFFLVPDSIALSGWSTPVEIGGVADIFPNSIAGFIFKVDDTYYMMIKDEGPVIGPFGKTNALLSSANLNDGYTLFKNYLGVAQNTYEALWCLPLGGDSFRLFGDAFQTGDGEHWWETHDFFDTFTVPQVCTGYNPPIPRSAYIWPIP